MTTTEPPRTTPVESGGSEDIEGVEGVDGAARQWLEDEEVRAAASWSALVEPDDAVAALVTKTWGIVESLEHLRHWHSTDTTGGSMEVPERVRRNLLDRVGPRLEGFDVRRDLEEHARLGGHVVLPGSRDWPVGLDRLTAPPYLLWVRGRVPWDLTQRGGVSIVGSRTATAYGQRVAADLAVHLSDRGISVVSGGAFGIDIAAHRGVLAQGGVTVAVLAGGLGMLYPRAHLDHFARMEADGALISELQPSAEPRRHRFLSRNRLIAGMTGGTVVVEAGLRSGALSTARHARELGRHLGAVPGPVTSTMSAGCHALIRDGATLITDAEDVREMTSDLVTLAQHPVAERRAPDDGLLDGLSPHASVVFDALPVRAAKEIAEVARAAGLSFADAHSALAVLELGGRVERVGDRWRRARVSR